jgi:predicted negative regulator of RcsB-dependent stress response
LKLVIENQPLYVDAYMLLGDIHEDQGSIEEARALYQQALRTEGLSRRDRYRLEAKLRELETSEKTQKGKNSNIPK